MNRDEFEIFLDRVPKPVLVGTLRPSFMGARVLASTSFQYDESYLRQADAYALSPDLPLISGRTYTPENTNIFGVFADASPDQWGRKIIEATHASRLTTDPRVPRRISEFDYLTGVSDHTRMGAIRLRRVDDSAWLSSGPGVASVLDLDHIMGAARRYEDDEATDDDMAYLLDIATSPGGARPKATVETSTGHLALVKLPHSKDHRFDVEAWEAVALTIAAKAGIATTNFAHQRASTTKSVLIVDRFDRTPEGGRLGYMSAATALGIGAHDDARLTYVDFADTLAELSAAPLDLEELFARVALTILLNNVDDHWRNHGFLRGDDGWRLSPMFDVNPSPRHGVITSRALTDDDDPRQRDIRNLFASSGAYRLKPDRAKVILNTVADAVEAWPDIATRLAISPVEQEAMSTAFAPDQMKYVRALTPDDQVSRR